MFALRSWTWRRDGEPRCAGALKAPVPAMANGRCRMPVADPGGSARLIPTILEKLDASPADHRHLLCPWSHNSFHCGLEIRGVARNESQSVDFRGGSDECVSRLHRAAHRLASGEKSAARIRYLKINRQDPLPKARCKVLSQPSVQMVATPAGGQSFNAITQFGNGDDTKKDAVLVHIGEPGEHTGIGPWLPSVRI